MSLHDTAGKYVIGTPLPYEPWKVTPTVPGVPFPTLTEDRVREIVRDELAKIAAKALAGV